MVNAHELTPSTGQGAPLARRVTGRLGMTPCGADCTTIRTPFWTADAHLQDSNWVATYPQVPCVTPLSKSFGPGTITTTFDKNTLAGTLSTVHVPGSCPGGSEAPMTMNIVLTKR